MSNWQFYAKFTILSDVGDAIIDYVLYARPKTDLKQVFVSFTNPRKPTSKVLVTSLVSKYIRESGVSTEDRHHEPHSLRHSVAQNMVNKSVKLHVVSENLGHKSMQSTMYNIGICVNDIMNCSNDVPPVCAMPFTNRKVDFCMNDYFFNSSLAPYMNEFLYSLVSRGLNATVTRDYLRQFDLFLLSKVYNKPFLDREIYDLWIDMKNLHKLSVFMRHKHVNDTEYYLCLTEEQYPELSGRVAEITGTISGIIEKRLRNDGNKNPKEEKGGTYGSQQ